MMSAGGQQNDRPRTERTAERAAYSRLGDGHVLVRGEERFRSEGRGGKEDGGDVNHTMHTDRVALTAVFSS